MELDEILQRQQHLRHLETRENGPVTPQSGYHTMERDELIRYIEFLQERLNEEKRARELSDRRFEEESAARKEADKRIFELLDKIDRMGEKHAEELSSMQEKIDDLTAVIRLGRKNKYATTSQRHAASSKKKGSKHRDEARDDHDGSGKEPHEEADVVVEETDESAPQIKEERDYRKGLKYNTMKASRVILHKSDRSQLPEGAVVIRTYAKRHSFDEVVEFVEHDIEVLVYKTADGKVKTAYLPYKDDDASKGKVSPVPGTHATSGLLSYIAFNKYQMSTPLYREIARFINHDMSISDGTLSNWLHKGCSYMKEMIPYLKDCALEKDSFVNCDETWCRVRKQGKYSKKYIWCLVNKEAKVVIFIYDDGSRGRKVLRDIIEDREIAALQSDAYNVYMFIDKELGNITHLCCMAHARARFKEALEQGQDARARQFLEWINLLYKYEEEYKNDNLDYGQIKKRRNDDRTEDILIKISTELDRLLKDENAHLGEMMRKALNYLHNYWKQLLAYRQDGRYTIDNNIAERNIRPITVERKNCMFHGSGIMAEVAAVYHTFICTCRMMGMSAQKYLKKFFDAIIDGRRDYENLLPMTIGKV